MRFDDPFIELERSGKRTGLAQEAQHENANFLTVLKAGSFLLSVHRGGSKLGLITSLF